MAAEKKKPQAKTASVPPKAAAAKSGAAKGGAAKGGAKKGPASKAPPPPPAAPAARASVATEVHKTHSFRRKMVGLVTSDKMDKTVTVEVVRRSLDPVYKKYVRERNRYKAHDELNQYRTGDRVEIQEHAPISREKRWLVTRLIARGVEA
jgi:small subunit ribosomal protein S17